MRTRLLTGAGFVLLLLGGVGVFLPVWPTTPFVLGAAGCFAGSPRLSAWLRKNRTFRAYLDHYQNGTPVARAATAKSLVFLWGMLLLSAALVRRGALWALLLAVGLGVSAHLLWIARRPGSAGTGERTGAVSEPDGREEDAL